MHHANKGLVLFVIGSGWTLLNTPFCIPLAARNALLHSTQAPDDMQNAHKGLVLLVIGSGWSQFHYHHVPDKHEMFTAAFAPYVLPSPRTCCLRPVRAWRDEKGVFESNPHGMAPR
ncbi:unnamed protein product, partial [Closterium sp. NIES-54]